MAVVVYARRAVEDLGRLVDFALEAEPDHAPTIASLIKEAVAVLARHPLIGRPAGDDLRELVISRGKTGYMALYRYYSGNDVVMVLALRHQREAGYSAP